MAADLTFSLAPIQCDFQLCFYFSSRASESRTAGSAGIQSNTKYEDAKKELLVDTIVDLDEKLPKTIWHFFFFTFVRSSAGKNCRHGIL